MVAGRTQPTGETNTEALVVRYGRELLRENGVSDGTFRAARNHLDVRGVVELTATFGYYAMIACVRNAFEVTPKEGAPTFQ